MLRSAHYVEGVAIPSESGYNFVLQKRYGDPASYRSGRKLRNSIHSPHNIISAKNIDLSSRN